MSERNIAIIGAGYVGLVAAACFAKKHNVVCVDIDEDKVELINNAKAPFYEPGLDELIKSGIKSGKLRATNDINGALESAEFIFISVGTPSKDNGEIDLSYVKSAAHDIGKALRNYAVVVQRSTVVPGTTRNVVKKIIEEQSGRKAGKDFGIAFVPEFLREGNAVHDFMEPDRVVIGADDDRVTDNLLELYRDFYPKMPDSTLVTMSIESAELVKYASNLFLATKISFANEVAELAEKIPNVDIVDVMRGVGLDKRIGPSYLGAGAGFGGSCFPKDLNAIVHFARKIDVPPFITEAVLKRNRRQIERIVSFVVDQLGKLDDKRIAVLGLSFKPGTSDTRESPALKIVNELMRLGAKDIIACDPKAVDEAKRVFGESIKYTEDPFEAIKNADCAVVVTDWDEFKNISPDDFAGLMRNPLVIDGRRIYQPEKFEGKVKLICVGRYIQR